MVWRARAAKLALVVGLVASLGACGQAPEAPNPQTAIQEPEAAPTDPSYSTDQPALPPQGAFGENCFGIDAPAALTLLAADGGRAESVRGSDVPTCHFMSKASIPLATVTVVPHEALARGAGMEAKKFADLQKAAVDGAATSFGPTETGVLTANLADGSSAPLAMYITGWADSAKGEIGFSGPKGAVLVRFDGPSKAQAKAFVEQQAWKAAH